MKPEHSKIIFGSNFASTAVSLSATPPQDFAQPFGGRDHGRSVQPAGLPRQSLDRTETLTAAMTFPEGERTGAETDATPGSRSPTE